MRDLNPADQILASRADEIMEEVRKYVEQRQTIGSTMHDMHRYLKGKAGSENDVRIDEFATKLRELQRLQCRNANVMYGLSHFLFQIDDVAKQGISPDGRDECSPQREDCTCSVM
jgi:hypothetical protein